MEEVNVRGDGNCMFRAISASVFGDEKRHAIVRSKCLAEMSRHPRVYRPYVPEPWLRFLSRMGSNRTWGDQVALSAIATAYGISITVHDASSQNAYTTPPQRGIRVRSSVDILRRNFHYLLLRPIRSK